MPKITPFLWFDTQAEEAANYYVSIFPNSRIHSVNNMGGGVKVVNFELDGQRVTALNGGPHFRLTEAFSFSVECQNQAEIDDYWSKLTQDGQESQCGWLKDKFGLSWQIVPANISQLLSNPRAMAALMQMKKIDIAALEQA
jgi:predicted 3-demethylubiquinone-9 3-methyltransferase (glyoxalase superfamily)